MKSEKRKGMKGKNRIHKADMGVIRLTSGLIKKLATNAKATMKSFNNIVAGMTKEQAEIVRKIRVDEGGTWRYVAQEVFDRKMFSKKWIPPSNQLMGMALCEKAAQFFDQDYMSDPWN